MIVVRPLRVRIKDGHLMRVPSLGVSKLQRILLLVTLLDLPPLGRLGLLD